MVRRSRKLLVLTALVSAFLSLVFPRCGSSPPRPVSIAGAGVHGSVLMSTPQKLQILVPDFEVFLRNTTTGATSAPVKTDLFGRYILRSQPQGRYQLCWNASGWVPGCAPTAVTIRIDTKYLPPTQIRPLITNATTAVSGRVAQGDGSSPWFVDPYFGINQTAIVTATAGSSVVATARANASGEYVLTSVPRSGATLTATVGGASISQTVVPSDFTFVPLTLKNRPPRFAAVAALVGGRGVRETEPGIDVVVVAEAVDPDGDPLQIEWRPAPADGTLTGRGSRARWSLPREAGRRVVYVTASDGNGGFARKQIVLTTGVRDVQFSGDVLTQSGAPIVDATITINGRPAALSNNRGAFRAQLPRADSYTVTVAKPGFAIASRIYDHGDVRDVYRLVRAQTRTVDPRAVIDFTDVREELQKKRMRGAGFVIPPNALVDASGAAPSGLLTNSTATLDIANGEMPGNFGAIADGRETNLISFGAVFTEFTDSSGRRYNLRPGTTARMTLPVPPAMLATAPPTIVLWSYNEATGFWDDSAGNATLDRSIGAYVGDVRHFSTVNTDIASGAAACLGVSLDATVPFSHVKVQVTYDSGPTFFTQAPEMLLDAADNGLIRLPANDSVKIRVIDVATNFEITNAVILDNGFTPAPGGVVNLGPATTPLDPLPPFSNCHPVVIKLLPTWANHPLSAFLLFTGVGSEPEAIGYYATVDPGSSWNTVTQEWSGGTRSTLGAWWAQAGFGPNGEDLGGIRAAYMNYNDLGFGRDMHIRSIGSNVYAYVTNYGGADQNPNNANLAQIANQSIAGATVAMEYTAQAGVPGPIVKFFVFNGGTSAAKRINSANLDGFGEKFVPNLCLNCHGGEFYAPSNTGTPSPLDVSLRPVLTNPVGASFREFDVPALRYPGGSATPDATTLQALFDLNQLVKLSNPQPAIKDLIDGWYTAPPAQDNTFTPTAWQSSASHINLYREVVATSCRTCHVAFSDDDAVTGINWTTFAQFVTNQSWIEPYVCGSAKRMPHALMTYRNFWLSTNPNRPTVLRDFSDIPNGWNPIGTCQ